MALPAHRGIARPARLARTRPCGRQHVVRATTVERTGRIAPIETHWSWRGGAVRTRNGGVRNSQAGALIQRQPHLSELMSETQSHQKWKPEGGPCMVLIARI